MSEAPLKITFMVITVLHPDGDADHFHFQGEEAELTMVRNQEQSRHGKIGKVTVLAVLATMISNNSKADPSLRSTELLPRMQRILHPKRKK